MQLLPLHETAFRDLVQTAAWIVTTNLKPAIYLFSGIDGGFISQDLVVTSELAAQPLQIAALGGTFLPGPVDPVIWAWDIKLRIVKFPNSAPVAIDVTAFTVIPRLPIQQLHFHFLESNLATGDRHIFPAGTLAPGDVFSIYAKTNLLHISTNYTLARYVTPAFFYYFSDVDLLLT